MPALDPMCGIAQWADRMRSVYPVKRRVGQRRPVLIARSSVLPGGHGCYQTRSATDLAIFMMESCE